MVRATRRTAARCWSATRLLEGDGIHARGAGRSVPRLATEGKTPMLVAVDGARRRVVAAADTIRPSAQQAIAALKALGLEVALI